MNRRLFLLTGIPVVMAGLVFCERRATMDEPGRDAAAVPSAEGTLPGPQEGSAAEESAAQQAEVLHFRLAGLLVAMPFRIDVIQPDGSGQVSLQFPEQEAADMARAGLSPAMVIGLCEGYYLGLTGLPTSRFPFSFSFHGPREGFTRLEDAQAMRVQITEVYADAKAAVRLGPGAAKRLKQGDMLFLLRPGGSTTAQLKAVPDIVAITDARSDVLDPRRAACLARSKNNLKQIGVAMHNFHVPPTGRSSIIPKPLLFPRPRVSVESISRLPLLRTAGVCITGRLGSYGELGDIYP